MRRASISLVLLLTLAACRDGGTFTDPFSGPRASITGIVTSSRNNAPIAGATIGVFTLDTSELAGSGSCDSSGRYTVTGIRPGHYRFYVNYLGNVVTSTEIDVHEGQNSYDIAVPL